MLKKQSKHTLAAFSLFSIYAYLHLCRYMGIWWITKSLRKFDSCVFLGRKEGGLSNKSHKVIQIWFQIHRLFPYLPIQAWKILKVLYFSRWCRNSETFVSISAFSLLWREFISIPNLGLQRFSKSIRLWGSHKLCIRFRAGLSKGGKYEKVKLIIGQLNLISG